MATVQSEVGRIRIFEDFLGPEYIIAETSTTGGTLGGFRVVGDGITETDSGIVILESDGLSGVAQLTTADDASEDSCGLVTAKCFDAALMGTLVAETRVRFDDDDNKAFFFGFCDENDDDQGIEGEIMAGATETLTLTASDICGFYFTDELTTDPSDWHMVYKGGTTTGETDSTEVNADDDIAAGEFQILRVEVDPNGTARWYIDGVLKQTVEGAMSTSTDVAVVFIVETKTAAAETAEVDYILVEANRDWTV